MNIEDNSNRVELEISNWQSKEMRLSKLFSSSSSIKESLLKEKLMNYEFIEAKYKDTKSLEERFSLRILKNEKRRILKELYPKKFYQLLYKISISLKIKQIRLKEYQKEDYKNNQFLKDQLIKIGFKDVFSKVERFMDAGKIQFTVPTSHYINQRERVNYELNFAKNENGLYQFQGYNTVLHNELKSGEQRHHYFPNENSNSFNLQESYNLLAGRAIEKESSWLQFDLNDKDASGNYRIKEFKSEYGYDLKNEIAKLPLKEVFDRIDNEKLIDDLKLGFQRSVVFVNDGKECQFYIEANPQYKSINIYDENFRKVTLNNALGIKTIKTVDQNIKKSEVQKLEVSKGKNMKIS